MKLYRILIIDQAEKFRKALITILHIEGYHAIGARSLEEAQKELKARDFHLVLLEFESVTGEDNVSFFNWIRRYKSQIPVVIMGDRALVKYRDEYLDDFTHGYILKPFEVADVRKITFHVDRAVERDNLEEQSSIMQVRHVVENPE